MKATHYIEVWKATRCESIYYSGPWHIGLLNNYNKLDNTIAIFKIRQTDVPLNERLERRSLIAGTVNVPDWMLKPLNSPS